jgi:hypothetical protein
MAANEQFLPIELTQADLYQNGRVIQFSSDSDELLLLRDLLPVRQEQTDRYERGSEGDELPLLAFRHYRQVVSNANQYWWIVADRNGVFDPLSVNFINSEGDLLPIYDPTFEVVIPNILTQQPELRR